MADSEMQTTEGDLQPAKGVPQSAEGELLMAEEDLQPVEGETPELAMARS